MLETTLVRIGRVIGKPPGWERVVRTLAPPTHFAGATRRAAPQDAGYVFPVDPGTLIGWNVHFFGTYEPEVRAAIRRVLQPGDVAIDVGANVGWHALLMAARVGPGGRVFACEPNPTTRERLAEAIAANRLANVRVEARAVTDHGGRMAFEAPPAGDLWDGTGRLVRGAAPAALAVECVTLDTLADEQRLAAIRLIKIDVEGWELAVLRGARHVLGAMRPIVIFEFDPAYISRCGGDARDLFHCLADAGYQMWVLRPRSAPAPVVRLGTEAGNFFAAPRERRFEP